MDICWGSALGRGTNDNSPHIRVFSGTNLCDEEAERSGNRGARSPSWRRDKCFFQLALDHVKRDWSAVGWRGSVWRGRSRCVVEDTIIARQCSLIRGEEIDEICEKKQVLLAAPHRLI